MRINHIMKRIDLGIADLRSIPSQQRAAKRLPINRPEVRKALGELLDLSVEIQEELACGCFCDSMPDPAASRAERSRSRRS